MKTMVDFVVWNEWNETLSPFLVVLVEGLTSHQQVKEIINKEEKDKAKLKGKGRRGWGSVGSVLSWPVPPTQHTHSLSLSISFSWHTPKSKSHYYTTLAFLAFCVFCASYAIVYVCCFFCSLSSVPANGGGGIILWIPCYHLMLFFFFSLLSFLFFGVCVCVCVWPSSCHDFPHLLCSPSHSTPSPLFVVPLQTWIPFFMIWPHFPFHYSFLFLVFPF